jgi:spore coat protein U-like protein
MDVSSLWSSAGGPRDITLCGLLETPQADASPGNYADTVVVTVTY